MGGWSKQGPLPPNDLPTLHSFPAPQPPPTSPPPTPSDPPLRLSHPAPVPSWYPVTLASGESRQPGAPGPRLDLRATMGRISGSVTLRATRMAEQGARVEDRFGGQASESDSISLGTMLLVASRFAVLDAHILPRG
jgi:hypothetical protein